VSDTQEVTSVPRRQLLLTAGLAALVSAAGGCTTSTAPRTQPSPTRATSVEPGATEEALPNPANWVPSSDDIEPEVKEAAVRAVELAATWDAYQGSPREVADRLRGAGYTDPVASALDVVAGRAEASVPEILLAQYGGLLATSASVLVALDQWLRFADGRVRRRGTTLDVRLSLQSGRWQVDAVRPARPTGAATRPTDVGERVLSDRRLQFPDAAAADVRARLVDDAVLTGLVELARVYRLEISVLRSGHPIRVFGTDRVSDHTIGRAVDVWAVDGRPVIEWGARRRTRELMRAALEVGAYQVGGPVDLDGAGPTTFSDDTHQDHIHLGF
jgi:hypothetical protein